MILSNLVAILLLGLAVIINFDKVDLVLIPIIQPFETSYRAMVFIRKNKARKIRKCPKNLQQILECLLQYC